MKYLNDEKNQRRIIFVFIHLCLLPVILFLAVFNFINRETHDLIVDLLLCVYLAASVFAAVKIKREIIVYRCTLIIWIFVVLYATAIGSGYGSNLFWMTVLPVGLIYFFGKKEGLFWTVIYYMLSIVLICFPQLLGTYSYNFYSRIGSLGAIFTITAITYGIETNRARFRDLLEEERNALATEKDNLQKALEEIRTLSGMLPICSHCKKIRDDRGYWQQVESYIEDHSEAEFTHGICPDCAARYYADELSSSEDDKK